MPNKVKTARGQTLDFDILKIKEQIATAPQELHVRKRKDFIEQRMRRKIKSVAKENEEVVKQEVVKQEMEVSPELPTTEKTKVETTIEELIEVEESTPPPSKPISKQRAKRRTTTTEPKEGGTDGTESNQ